MVELIDFSDCEGILGAETCKRLLASFREYREKMIPVLAKEWCGDEELAESEVDEWIEILEFASDGGCLMFA